MSRDYESFPGIGRISKKRKWVMLRSVLIRDQLVAACTMLVGKGREEEVM